VVISRLERRRPVEAAGLAVLVVALEYGRILLARQPSLALVALVGGGGALCLTAVGWRARDLGLGWEGWPMRLLGGLALTAVLLLPSVVRWHGGPVLGAPWAAAAIAVSVGEELAFRGALFAALESVAGGPAAVVVTTLTWTAAHALSHPPLFLIAVAGAGLLLGTWRLVARDLVGPIVAHVLADILL
jgi:membrane protease YdiL (CAAX protease family)